MSWTVNNTIFDSSTDDVNLLSTKRDHKTLLSGTTTFQFEPAIVIDIVLDDRHPAFLNGALGKITVPNESPPDYRGKTPSVDDPDYFSIGIALIRFCYSHEKFERESLVWAVPMDPNMSALPVLHEVVHVVKIFDKFYYTNPVNTKNSNHISSDFRYEQTYGKKLSVDIGDVNSRLDSFPGKSPMGFNGTLGNYFKFNPKIRKLKRYEGDVVIEGRNGESIRFSSYDSNREIDSGNHPIYQDGGGNPSVLIRNRQRLLSQMESQKIHPLLPEIPQITGSINEKNYGGYIEEDINHDGSSIHITSGKTESKFRTTCYKRLFSKSSPEEQPAFNPTNSTTFNFPKLNGDQVVINSDRLLFSSRFGETFHFSKKRYSVVTDSEFTVDSHEQLVLNTNSKIVLNSPAIYLGEYNSTGEPALLGQTTVNWLYDLCNWLLEHTHFYSHSHPGAGGASPDKTQTPVQVQKLVALRDSLHTLMSRRVFITGGGFAPGANGGGIIDGSTPVKIDIQSGNGVPGGWTGKNRR